MARTPCQKGLAMTPHRNDRPRQPGRCRPRGRVARTDNRPHRRFPRGRPLSLAILLLPLALLLPAAAAATDRQATPAAVTTDQLVEATLGSLDLPRAVDTLALARVTLSPGATATALNGAHLFV